MINALKPQWKKENNKDIFKKMKLTRIFFLLLLCNLNLAAQTEKNIDHQSILWTRYYNQLTINDKWAIHSEFDNRLFIKPVKENLFVIRVQARYKIKEIELGAGLVYFSVYSQIPEVDPGFTVPEYRLQQDVTTKQNWGKIVVNHRYQIEERFIHNFDKTGLTNGTSFSLRFRYRIQGSCDFWKKEKQYLKGILSDEIMINAGSKIVKNTFDQNRIYVGLQWGISKTIATEIGYLNSFQQRASGVDYFNRNIIRISMYHKLKV